MNQAVDKYDLRAEAVNSLVCVGLDSELEKLPESVRSQSHPQFEFNTAIIDATHQFVAAYKPNIAFYEARGAAGLADLKLTMDYLHSEHPDIYTICDAKRADIGSTNGGYVTEIFDELGFDAVTLHPYLGKEALEPFLERTDKQSIILCRTSNPGAAEFQDQLVGGVPLWELVARTVSGTWNRSGNCLLVVGATYPEELRRVRAIVGDMTLLVPGVGAQGGSVEDSVTAGLNATRRGMIINSSRAIIFASTEASFAEAAALAAQSLRDEINTYR